MGGDSGSQTGAVRISPARFLLSGVPILTESSLDRIKRVVNEMAIAEMVSVSAPPEKQSREYDELMKNKAIFLDARKTSPKESVDLALEFLTSVSLKPHKFWVYHLPIERLFPERLVGNTFTIGNSPMENLANRKRIKDHILQIMKQHAEDNDCGTRCNPNSFHAELIKTLTKVDLSDDAASCREIADFLLNKFTYSNLIGMAEAGAMIPRGFTVSKFAYERNNAVLAWFKRWGVPEGMKVRYLETQKCALVEILQKHAVATQS